jgi:hypothetical protein
MSAIRRSGPNAVGVERRRAALATHDPAPPNSPSSPRRSWRSVAPFPRQPGLDRSASRLTQYNGPFTA